MTDETCDVLVVGAGPAGCSTAFFLARQGFAVTVVDRAAFPRDKICGDGLAPRTVTMLRRMGLEERLRAAGYIPARRYRIVSTWGDAVMAGMPSFGKGAEYAYVVPRRELDLLLVEAARAAGARMEEQVRALRFEGSASGPRAPRVLLQRAGGGVFSIRARVVVAADGSRGSFSRTVMPSERLEPDAVAVRAYVEDVQGLEGALSFFLDRNLLPGYGWVFPGGRAGAPANVGLGVKVTALRRRPEGLRALFDWFLSPASSAWPFLRGARLVSPPATFPLQLDFAKGRRREGVTLFAGDAANLIDPLSGEGIAYALESGWAAAEAVARGLRSGRLRDLAGYEAAVWRGLSLEFLGAFLLRQLLVRPWGNGVVVRLLQRDEGLARGGMGVLSNSVPATWLFRPAVLRRVFSPRRLAAAVAASHPARG